MPFLAERLLSAENAFKNFEFQIFEISLLDQNLVSTKSYLVILASVDLHEQ